MNTLTVPPDQGNLSAGDNPNLGMLLQEGYSSVTGEVQFTLRSNIVGMYLSPNECLAQKLH